MNFEWDDEKEESNFRKHGVHFDEASTLWSDVSHPIDVIDPEHSLQEERWIRLGYSDKNRLLVVVFTERNDGYRMRIISARKATATEKAKYNWRKNER